MLVNFQDSMECRGSVPYDEISSIREDNGGFAILRLKSEEIILTNMTYKELIETYHSAIAEDINTWNSIDD